MSPLRIGSLFSGGGGLDMGVRSVVGGELAWMAEHYRPARRVLEHNHPGVPLYGDIAAANWSAAPTVDVVVAGFPCTDVSLLGKREGLRPDRTADHLFNTPSGWDLTVRVLRAVRPSVVILENVSALLTAPATAVHDDARGSAFGVVLHDLAELGLDAEWACVDASAVGAPHRRRRVFVVASAADAGGVGLEAGDLGQPGGAAPVSGDVDWGPYAAAIAGWEHRTGRRAPDPTEPHSGPHGRRLSARFVEWMMGLPAGHVTDVPGLTRRERITVLDNGVVPQQAALATRTLLERLSEPVQAVAS